jgi:membrane protein required for colicin V production
MENYSFHIVDGIVLAIIGISAVVGFVRGFSREMLSIASWALALVISLYAHSYTYPFWSNIIKYPVLAHAATFGVVFIGVLTTSLIVTNGWANRIGDGPLGSLDRTLGLVFGVTRGGVIVCLAYLIMASLGETKNDVPDWLKEAKSLAWAEEGGVLMVGLLPKQMQEPVAETVNIAEEDGRKGQKSSKNKPSLQPQRFVTSGMAGESSTKAATAVKKPATATAKSAGKPEHLDQDGMDALVESVQ